jgi:hypothetical protein
MYVASSICILGNPTGFQRCVNADNAKGITSRKTDRNLILLKTLRPN